MSPEGVILAIAMAASITYTTTPLLARKLKNAGMAGADVHKPGQPVRAEMGGLACLLASASGGLILILFQSDGGVLLALLTVVLVGLVGVADDIFGIRQRYKPFLVGVASIPLILAIGNRHGFTIPFLGFLDFGVLYLILLVPLGVATSANLTNMLAGFNGLEMGTGSIILLGLTFLSVYKGIWVAASLGGLLTASLLPFLKYNWYPASVFPGDTGTLFVGAGIASVALLAGLEFVGILSLMPATIDFALKITNKRPFGQRSFYGDTRALPDGILAPPPYRALAHVFLRMTPMGERDLVLSMILMQSMYSIAAIIISLANIAR